MFNTKIYNFKEGTTDEMQIRVTFIEGFPQVIEHLVDGHAVSATRVKPLNDNQRKLLDTERKSGIVLNPCMQLIRVFELLTA